MSDKVKQLLSDCVDKRLIRAEKAGDDDYYVAIEYDKVAKLLTSRVPEAQGAQPAADVRRLREDGDYIPSGASSEPRRVNDALKNLNAALAANPQSAPHSASVPPGIPPDPATTEQKWKQCIEWAREHKSYALHTALTEDGPDPKVDYDKLMGNPQGTVRSRT